MIFADSKRKIWAYDVFKRETSFLFEFECAAIDTVTCMCVSRNNRYLCVGSSMGNYTVFNIEKKEILKTGKLSENREILDVAMLKE